MIFLTDVDEVLADFAKHVYESANLPFPESPSGWDLFDAMDPDTRERVSKMVDAEGFCASLPVCPGAQKGIERLRSIGCEIVAVTSPWKRCKTWEYERRNWLKEHFNITDVISTARKDLVHGDFFLDDKPEHVFAWAKKDENRGRSLLWNTPFNQVIKVPPVPSGGVSGERYEFLRHEYEQACHLQRFCRDARMHSWDEIVGYVRACK